MNFQHRTQLGTLLCLSSMTCKLFFLVCKFLSAWKVMKIFIGIARKYLNQTFHCEANPCLHSLQSGLKNFHWGRFLNLSRAPASKFHLLMKLFLAPSWAFLYYKVIVSVLYHYFMYSKSAFSPFVLKLGKFWGILSIAFRFTKNKQTKKGVFNHLWTNYSWSFHS